MAQSVQSRGENERHESEGRKTVAGGQCPNVYRWPSMAAGALYCCGSAHGASTKSHTSAMWSDGQEGEGSAQVSDCSGGGCGQAGGEGDAGV